MRIWTLLAVLSFTINCVYGQSFYESKQFGIKIQNPNNWILAKDEDLENNSQKIEFSEEQLIKLLNSKRGILSLCSYYKYKINSVAGLIPTVKVTVRSNPASNSTKFKEMMVTTTNRTKTVVNNFEFIENLKEVNLSGYSSLYYNCRYSLNQTDGGSIKVRTRYYMIPKGKYFISISLMDNETNENCSKIYDQLISSLELSK